MYANNMSSKPIKTKCPNERSEEEKLNAVTFYHNRDPHTVSTLVVDKIVIMFDK